MRINHILVKAEVKKVKPNIYAVIIKDDYDRAMLFCRYQEFYESPFKEIRNKFFTLETLMRVYTKKNKKQYFTYPGDWVGYNIPSDSLYSACEKFDTSLSSYDYIMRDIIYFCERNSNGKPFYLIGVDKFKSGTMDHEIAHGLYHTNEKYKTSVDRLISEIPKKEYNLAKRELLKMGYVNEKRIIDDEIQAFFSTGLVKGLSISTFKIRAKKFSSNFKSFM